LIFLQQVLKTFLKTKWCEKLNLPVSPVAVSQKILFQDLKKIMQDFKIETEHPFWVTCVGFITKIF